MSTALLIAISFIVVMIALVILCVATSIQIEKIDEPLFPDEERPESC